MSKWSSNTEGNNMITLTHALIKQPRRWGFSFLVLFTVATMRESKHFWQDQRCYSFGVAAIDGDIGTEELIVLLLIDPAVLLSPFPTLSIVSNKKRYC